MDDKEALREFLENEDYITKMHNLSWKALTNLFLFFLNQILGKGHIDNADIENILYCFGVVFVRKNMTTFKMFRQEALKVSKIYMLEKIIKVASEKCLTSSSSSNDNGDETPTKNDKASKKKASENERLAKMNDAFMKNINRCLTSLKTIRRASINNRRTSIAPLAAGAASGGARRGSVRRVSIIQSLAKTASAQSRDNRYINVLKKLDLSSMSESIFNDSLTYLLSKYGTELQDNLLLDRLAERIATNYFKTARKINKLDLSEFDPLVGDTSCQIRCTVIASLPILAQAALDIDEFDHNLVDRETKVFLGKCLMLTQKIPEEDALENIVSTIRQQTPTNLPPEWCKFLLIKEGSLRDAKRILIKLKRDIARESLNRLEGLVKSLEKSELRQPLLEVLASNKREKSSLGIEMAPMFLTAVAMLEIAKERDIPICFHVLNTMFHNEAIEVVKWDLIFYTFDEDTKQFEKCPHHLSSSEPVFTIRNVWYEGSNEQLNYGEDFIDWRFILENYVETWKAHPELSSRMVELREKFLKSVPPMKRPGFDFPGCFEYLKLKEELGTRPNAVDALEKVKETSFMFVSHVYPSTVGVEKQLSVDLNGMDWEPCSIEIKPLKVAENKFYNRRYWEKRSRLEAVPMPGPTRRLSLQFMSHSLLSQPSTHLRKASLIDKQIIEEEEEEEEL